LWFEAALVGFLGYNSDFDVVFRASLNDTSLVGSVDPDPGDRGMVGGDVIDHVTTTNRVVNIASGDQ
jgi:hypothetical protein